MITYRWATLEDLNLLVELRLQFISIRTDDKNFIELYTKIRSYFEKAINENTCHILMALKDGKVVGTGMIFYYDSVPSMLNISGKNAYITNMYVDQYHRRNGIGGAILKQLVERAKSIGYQLIQLSTTDGAKKFYEEYGFVKIDNNMMYHA